MHNSFKITPDIADIELMAYVCDPKNTDGKLEELFTSYCNLSAAEIQAQISNLPALYEALHKKINENELIYINEIEHYLLFILYDMEKQGIAIDSEGLDALSVRFTQEISEVSQKIYTLAGEEFNIS